MKSSRRRYKTSPPAPTLPNATAGMAQKEADNQEVERPRVAKRARVAVACTRCKSRKQKCDGGHPSCSNCKNLAANCEYIVPSKTMPYGKYQYVKALEGRVAELESLLAGSGLADSGKDYLEEVRRNEDFNSTSLPPQSPTTEQRPLSSLVGVIAPNSGSKRQQDHVRSEPESAVQYLNDLSLDGAHAGEGSSNITAGHIFSSIVRERESTLIPTEQQPSSYPGPKFLSRGSENASREAESRSSHLSSISDETAEILFKAYIQHISTRWLALYPPQIRCLHEKRRELQDPFEISTLNLVYAIAGRFLQTTGEKGNFFPERQYLAALDHLDKVLQSHDIQSVQTLLLHAIYCLRAPRGLSAWTHIGLAIRICIEKGMHRNTYSERPSIGQEMRKRIFWSCYCLDRQVSIILGRPFAISDRDIDADLPLDIDDNMDDAGLQVHFLNQPQNPHPSTSLSCFIHTVRLRVIESHIQQSVYRVDMQRPLPDHTIEAFLTSLQSWKDTIPSVRPLQDTDTSSYDDYDYYMIYYYKCLRFLLYPYLTTPDVNTATLVNCADACGGVCRTYKRLHRQTSVGFSLMALYSVFLSGLTLLYCMWLSPAEVYNISTSNDANSCSIVLYIITERWPGARKYRDAYESIKQCILDLIEEGRQQPRQKLRALEGNAELRDVVREVRNLHPEGQREFGRMMRDMVGENQRDGEIMEMGMAVMSEQQLGGQQEAEFQRQPYGPDVDANGDVLEGMMYQNGKGQEVMDFYGMANGNPIPAVKRIGDVFGKQGQMLSPDMLDDFDIDDFLLNLNPLGDGLI